MILYKVENLVNCMQFVRDALRAMKDGFDGGSTIGDFFDRTIGYYKPYRMSGDTIFFKPGTEGLFNDTSATTDEPFIVYHPRAK